MPTSVSAAAAALILVWFCMTLGGTASGGSEAGRAAAEDAVKRAAVTCYAIEGTYPPDYAYLRDRYGVAVDEDRYIVHYEIFASNIMPEIAVLTNAVRASGGGAS